MKNNSDVAILGQIVSRKTCLKITHGHKFFRQISNMQKFRGTFGYQIWPVAVSASVT